MSAGKRTVRVVGACPRLFVNVIDDYEYDRFQNLDLRFVLGGGFGFHAVKAERSTLDFLGGVNYNHSKFSSLTRNAAEAFWGDEYTFKLNGASSLVSCPRGSWTKLDGGRALSKASNAGQDLVRRPRPDEGFGGFVMDGNVLADGGL